MNKKPLYLVAGLMLLVGLPVWFGRQGAAPFGSGTNGTSFSRETEGLKVAEASQPVELRDSDTYDLTAGIVQKKINGKPVKMLAYNGSIPGPLIKVMQGSQVAINFKNETDVATTLHSHGVRLENKFDGAPPLTQKEVKPGGSFTYRIKFPDAGMYWYHPHVREDYAQELGLYGNFLVEPQDPSYWSPVNREVPLMVDDILLDQQGMIVPFDKGEASHTLMGRFGNVMLINGETDFRFEAMQGEVVRFYLTNTASVRPFNIVIPGAKMKLVGGDGGKYEREIVVDSVLLGPSERAIIEVLFDKAGTYALQHKTPAKTYTLGTITVGSEKASPSYMSQFNTLRSNQDIIASIYPLRAAFDKLADKKLTLTIGMMGMGAMGGNMMSGSGNSGMHMMGNGQMMSNSMMTPLRQGSAWQVGGSEGSIEWEDNMAMMNQMSNSQMMQWKITDQATNKSNMNIDWNFKVGDKVKVSIFNDPKSAHPMQHPLHFHGQRFLVLSKDGVPNDNLVWKDTVLVGAGETVDILLDVTNPGEWMAHCHIAEHLEDGMMFSFKVNP